MVLANYETARQSLGPYAMRFFMELHEEGNLANRKRCNQLWNPMSRNGDINATIIYQFLRALEDNHIITVDWHTPRRLEYRGVGLLPAARALFPLEHDCLASRCNGLYREELKTFVTGVSPVIGREIVKAADDNFGKLDERDSERVLTQLQTQYPQLVAPNLGPAVFGWLEAHRHARISWANQDPTYQLAYLTLRPSAQKLLR